MFLSVSDGVFCFHNRNQTACKFVLQNLVACYVIPDFLACLTAIDQVIAVRRPHVHKQRGTQQLAITSVVVVVLVVEAATVPRFVESVINRGGRCVSMIPKYDKVAFLTGTPAVLAVTLLTAVLILTLKRRSTNSTATKSIKSSSTSEQVEKFPILD